MTKDLIHMQNYHDGRVLQQTYSLFKILRSHCTAHTKFMSCKLKHQFYHDPKVNVSLRVMYMELENVYETKHSRFAN